MEDGRPTKDAFGREHYVPVLKGKRGEFTGLRELVSPAADRCTPLIEIEPIPLDWDDQGNSSPAKSLAEHLDETAGRAAKSWVKKHRAFVDCWALDDAVDTATGQHCVSYLFDKLRAEQAIVIPVVWIDASAAARFAVRDVALQDGRGFCIRCSLDDAVSSSLAADLAKLVKDLRHAVGSVDLVIDAGLLVAGQEKRTVAAMDLAVRAAVKAGAWRTLTFAASSFPSSTAGLGQGLFTLPRIEALVWKALAKTKGLPRVPTFGDFSIQGPDFPDTSEPPWLRVPSANIRYTIDDEWLVARGFSLKTVGHGQFHDLCKLIVGDSRYCGRAFSWGDARIDDCAKRKVGPGTSETWRSVGTNHHVTFVTDRLASTGAP
jgi:hypothetical protein